MIKISNAELEVMKIIWKDKAVTSKQIIEQVKEFNWNDNTVRTLIKKLIAKNAVGILDNNEKVYTFIPLIDEEDYKSEVKQKFLKTFFNGSALEFIEFLMDNDEKYYKEICNFLKNQKDMKK